MVGGTNAEGSSFSSFKTNRGGYKALGQKLVEIVVWIEFYLNGTVQPFREINEYMDIRGSLQYGSDRFFLYLNPKGKSAKGILLRGNRFVEIDLGLDKKACISENMCGSETKYWVKSNELRDTLAFYFFLGRTFQ